MLSQLQRISCVLALGALSYFSTAQTARAQEQPRPPRSDEARGGEANSNKPEATPAIPPEKSSVTHHDLNLDGKALHYTATAGTLLIRDGEDDHPYGSIFSVAYTLDGADPNTRPVTFLYNGGPGSATIWLHMGSVGPVRVVTASPNATRTGAVPGRSQRVQPAGQERPGVHRCAADRLFASAWARARTRTFAASIRTLKPSTNSSALGHGEPALELAQVPLWRVVRHAAVVRDWPMRWRATAFRSMAWFCCRRS